MNEFKIGDKVEILDINNYLEFVEHYNVPRLSEEYLKKHSFYNHR